jgi:hypothetical protein
MIAVICKVATVRYVLLLDSDTVRHDDLIVTTFLLWLRKRKSGAWTIS